MICLSTAPYLNTVLVQAVEVVTLFAGANVGPNGGRADEGERR